MTAHAPTHLSRLEWLQRIPLLQGADEALLLRASQVLLVRDVERHAVVLHKGSPGDHLLFCLLGHLRAVDLTEDGRELGLNTFVAGDTLGELSVIDGQPRSANVVALTRAKVAWLPKDMALDLLYQCPSVAQRMMAKLAAGLRQASKTRAILGAQTVHQRVYALLNDLMICGPGGLYLVERMPTQHEIALQTGTSRESVSRAMGHLIKDGVIEKDLRRLIIRKPDALQRAAQHGLGHSD